MLTVLPFSRTTPRHPQVAALSFDELRELAQSARTEGRLDEALAYCDQAYQLARQGDDESQLDLAFCNRAAVLIPLGRHEEVLTPLREIMVRSRDPQNCFLAAYNSSQALVRAKSHKKALFYARAALDRARADGHVKWLVLGHNQLGNCLLDESYCEEANAEYEHALALLDEAPSVLRASLLCNYGYARMMLGKLSEAWAFSFQALRWLRRFRARSYEVWPHLDLCYAYLEVGRHDRARQHGERALALAEMIGDPDRIKNALFLLGETERSAGAFETAHTHFSRLQQRYYPDSPHLVNLMVAVEMRNLVNLRT